MQSLTNYLRLLTLIALLVASAACGGEGPAPTATPTVAQQGSRNEAEATQTPEPTEAQQDTGNEDDATQTPESTEAQGDNGDAVDATATRGTGGDDGQDDTELSQVVKEESGKCQVSVPAGWFVLSTGDVQTLASGTTGTTSISAPELTGDDWSQTKAQLKVLHSATDVIQDDDTTYWIDTSPDESVTNYVMAKRSGDVVCTAIIAIQGDKDLASAIAKTVGPAK